MATNPNNAPINYQPIRDYLLTNMVPNPNNTPINYQSTSNL